MSSSNGRPWTTTFEYVDREGIRRLGKGRTFVIEGRKIDLFPTGVLAEVLHRSRKTIYKWEEFFGFPQALFHINEELVKNRWYSREQLVSILAIYQAFGELKGEHRSDLPKMIKAIRKVFIECTIPKETNGKAAD